MESFHKLAYNIAWRVSNIMGEPEGTSEKREAMTIIMNGG